MTEIDKSPFLNPQLTPESLDYYWAKKSILEAIKRSLPNFYGTLLDIGCGQQPYRTILLSPPSCVSSYRGLDLAGTVYGGQSGPFPDIRWDGVTIPLADKSIDTAFATEVFEHCPDPSSVMMEIYRVLKDGGRLFFTVPFLWPIHDAPSDFFRYTPFALERLLNQAGFGSHEIEALGGWDASLAQMIGLWIRRRPISHRYGLGFRRALSLLLFPVIRYLYKKDRRPESFMTNTMITGISCLAVK